MPDAPLSFPAADPCIPACLTDTWMQAKQDKLKPRSWRLTETLHQTLCAEFFREDLDELFGVPIAIVPDDAPPVLVASNYLHPLRNGGKWLPIAPDAPLPQRPQNARVYDAPAGKG